MREQRGGGTDRSACWLALVFWLCTHLMLSICYWFWQPLIAACTSASCCTKCPPTNFAVFQTPLILGLYAVLL